MNDEVCCKVHWVRQDHYGTVRSAYRAKNGKLYYPRCLGSIWGDIRHAYPGHPEIDSECFGAVYWIPGLGVRVCESVSSKVFKSYDVVAKRLRNAFLLPEGVAQGVAIGNRFQLCNEASKQL